MEEDFETVRNIVEKIIRESYGLILARSLYNYTLS